MKVTDGFYAYPESAMMDCNTYVIKDKTTVVVDPGSLQSIGNKLKQMARDGINLPDIKIITNTHLHGDHHWADQELKKLSGAKVLCHPAQREHYNVTVIEVGRFFGSSNPPPFKEDGFLDSKLNTGNLDLEIIPTPGHSPDSVCIYCRQAKVLICGDVIFNQSTGRVDFPGGSADVLKQSIEMLAKLDIEYLLPGHMEPVVGVVAVKHNFQFVRETVFPWL